MAKRILEIGKDILIGLLALAIVVLTLLALPARTVASVPWLAAALRPVAPLFGMSQSELAYAGGTVDNEQPGAAQPVAISVHTSAGRMSAQYDFGVLDTAFEQLGGYLAQALDSAEGGNKVSEQAVCRALRSTSAAFRYPAATDPALAAAWLRADTAELPAAQWYILSVEDGAVALYLVGDGCYRAQTQLSAQALETALGDYRPDGSFFAFEDETGAYELAENLSLILPSAQPKEVLSVNPCEARFLAALATRLDLNPYGDAKYVDSSGTTFFTETTHTLRITAGGRLTLQVNELSDRFSAAASSDESRVEAARELLATITSGALGDARLYFTGLQETAAGTVCEFAYYLNGIPVASLEPARVTFSGTQITQVSMTLRTLQLTAQSAALLPPAQAAAILKAGQLLTLQYTEQEEGVLRAAWKG